MAERTRPRDNLVVQTLTRGFPGAFRFSSLMHWHGRVYSGSLFCGGTTLAKNQNRDNIKTRAKNATYKTKNT